MNNATSRPEAPSSGAAAGGDPVGGARRSGIAGLISEPNFRRLWIAGSFSGTVRWLETLAVAVFVFDRTGDAFIVALMMFFRMLPMFLFGAVAGVVADRIDRKTMLVGGFLILAANSIIMGVLALTDVLEIWHLAIGIFISGIVWSSEFPVRRTMMGEVAGMDRVGLAMGLDSATVNATRMLGPTLGGVLLQYLDLEGVFFVGAGFYLAAFVTAIPVSYVQGASPTKGLSFIGNLRSGFGYIRSRRVVVGILAVTIMVNIFGFPYVAMVPVIGKDELGLSPVLIGVLASAEGLGALITALTIATRAGPLKYTRIYLYGSFLFLVSVLLRAFAAHHLHRRDRHRRLRNYAEHAGDDGDAAGDAVAGDGRAFGEHRHGAAGDPARGVAGIAVGSANGCDGYSYRGSDRPEHRGADLAGAAPPHGRQARCLWTESGLIRCGRVAAELPAGAG